MTLLMSVSVSKSAEICSKCLSNRFNFFKTHLIYRKYSTMDKSFIEAKTKRLAPPLTNDRHKGQAGRIGVFGGSLAFTGAPYFAAMSSLKVGADLSYVFCVKSAASVIKSYSPELMVLPVLDEENAMEKIEPWLERLHVILIGPGLGRDEATFQVIEKLIATCRAVKKPLVIDADGLFLIARKPNLIKDYPAKVVLTPNAMEFTRLVGEENVGDGDKIQRSTALLNNLGSNVTILCKDHEDEIINGGQSVKVSGGGSGRRCGGQGDLLGGALSTFLWWSLQQKVDSCDFDYRPVAACYAASKLTRLCNEKAFAKHGRSMTCTDMIKEIHTVFQDQFELS